VKEFILYIYCSFTGNPLHYQYTLPGEQWDRLADNFRYFASQLNIDDNILLSVEEDEILIQEFYDSGVRARGSSVPINNEAWTAIRKTDGGVNIAIDIWRASAARILTNIFTILSLITTLFCLLISYYWLAGYGDANPLPSLIATFILISIVALSWLITSMKYKSIKKGINAIIAD
jgi:hypothetical protein